MKKKYDCFNKCYFLFFMFLIYLLCISIYLLNSKLIIYKVFDGVIFSDDIILLVVSDDDLKLFNKNKKIFINDKGYKFNIFKIDSNVLERKGVKYNNLFIEINMSNMYKISDVLSVSIMDSKVWLFKIFNVIWDGD